MKTISKLEYEVLSHRNVDGYQHLTYPAYRSRLQSVGDSSVLAIGVREAAGPIGLVLASYSPEHQAGEIMSWFVVPEYRSQGIGTALLGRMEQLLAQQGCKEVSLVFIKNSVPESFLGILERGNWCEPQPRMLMGESNCISWDNPALVSGIQDHLQRSPLPAAFTIFPWHQALPDELAKLQGEVDVWYPEILTPFQEIELIEDSNSLGLRYDGEIVGWIITHRITADKIRYTSLFVREDLRRVGRSVPPLTLLLESFARQAQHSQVANASFTVWDYNDKMLRIIHRRIAPFLHSIRYSMGTSKFLQAL